MRNDSVGREALSIEEAASAAGIGRTLLYELIGSGKGPATIKLGRRRLIRREALEEWLKRLEVEQSAEHQRGNDRA